MQNYLYKELNSFTIGQIVEKEFKVSHKDLQDFIIASKDYHPLHTNIDFAKSKGYPDVLVHGMLVNSRCSAFIAEEFVGKHGLLISVNADFRSPVFCEMKLCWRAKVVHININGKTLEIQWKVINDAKLTCQIGTACTYLGEEK